MSTTPRKGRPVGASRVEAARSGPRVPVFALVVAGLVVLLVVAALVVRLAGDDGEETTAGPAAGSPAAGDAAFGPVAVEGEPLPALPEGGPDPAVGADAPVLEGRNPAGEPVTIDPAEGPMVIAFVAHWCPHCQAEVPRIVELAAGSDEVDGVRLVAVATDSDPTRGNYPPGPWLASEGWPALTMVDSEAQDAAAAYGLGGYPFLVGIDGDGKVVARSSGELGDDGLRSFFARVAEA